MVTDINARVLRRIVLVVVINVNSPQVAPTQTLLPPSRLVILVDDDEIVITGLVLLLLGVEDDVLLHLVAGAVVITGLLLLKNYKYINQSLELTVRLVDSHCISPMHRKDLL